MPIITTIIGSITTLLVIKYKHKLNAYQKNWKKIVFAMYFNKKYDILNNSQEYE